MFGWLWEDARCKGCAAQCSYDEVADVHPELGIRFTDDDIPRLKPKDAVMQEGQNAFPPAPPHDDAPDITTCPPPSTCSTRSTSSAEQEEADRIAKFAKYNGCHMHPTNQMSVCDIRDGTLFCRLPSKEDDSSEEETEFECDEAGSIDLVRRAAVPGALLVSQIDNKSCFSKRRDRHNGMGNGDMIFQVNDIRVDTKAMRLAIEQSQKGNCQRVKLKIKRRPRTFDVEIPRVGPHWRQLGVDISPDKIPGVLWVARLQETGLVPAWNEAHCDRLICVGDVITAIGTVSEDSKAMIAAARQVREGQVLHLRVESSP
jgi:hypothetical protein